METLNNKRKKASFVDYEVAEVETEIKSGVEVINTVEANTEVILTPAHTEALSRLELAQMAIIGEKFTTFTKEQKQELIDELIWLTSINNQLIKSY
jgi:hypothetical protein